MCELFGVTSAGRVAVNAYLREFSSHSVNHPNGWGMAIFYGDGVSLEKEPLPAWRSAYLQSRLKHPFEVTNMIAHIRLATRGAMEYENCHPFVDRDDRGRAWTLAHNGTIFQSEILERYRDSQEGGTDSERILCHLVQEVNRYQGAFDRALSARERFQLVDQIILRIAEHNKVNLLIYDGELFYVHTNYRDSLFYKREGSAILFATVPLDGEPWEPVPFLRLLAYKNGALAYEGTKHSFEYTDTGEHRQLFDYANL